MITKTEKIIDKDIKNYKIVYDEEILDNIAMIVMDTGYDDSFTGLTDKEYGAHIGENIKIMDDNKIDELEDISPEGREFIKAHNFENFLHNIVDQLA